ncbi:MAG: glutamate--cysteine ligase [Rhodospirillales bacterium]|nr:glutamate--cysteine ligase [Rhodospirillales bacterium]MDE2199245.1 glutamate--cysteine ligase [Rhodospirillales bacterium]MDE2575420.1 glutamate--cysteine ligase [Rhodospirillales bacterium]
MSNPGAADATPIRSLRQLADHIAVGCKPAERFTIGTEHEKFGFRKDDFSPPPYEPGGIRAILEGIAANGWTPITDHGNPIGLTRGDASVSLEPAGQLELSGGLMADLHATRAEMEAHYAEVRAVAGPLGLGFAPLGFHPTATREAMPWMPKGRYAIMRRYMPRVGSLGLDMMTRTCTVQVNLDYASEADMVRKLRVALALQPVATALFANSPFADGKPSGFLSYRAHVWTDTDNQRSGIPAVFFEDGFGFERYVQWLVDDVPMYFAYRDDRYIDLAGQSFRRFLDGRLPEAAGAVASVGDFADHMTTVFTDVRLKRFLEMRGADAGSLEMMVAQSALWVGLLYDPAALAAAAALVQSHDWRDFAALRPQVARRALDAPFGAGTVRDLARDMVAIAGDGLRARARRDAAGQDERIHLAPLAPLVAGAPTQAEAWLSRFNGAWRGDITRIFAEAAI